MFDPRMTVPMVGSVVHRHKSSSNMKGYLLACLSTATAIVLAPGNAAPTPLRCNGIEYTKDRPSVKTIVTAK